MEIAFNGIYTNSFKENLVIMKKTHTSQEIASYLNSIGASTALGYKFQDSTINRILYNYYKEVEVIDTSPVEPSLTMPELMTHPQYNHILGRLNAIRTTEKQIAKLEREQVKAYEMLNKLVTEEK